MLRTVRGLDDLDRLEAEDVKPLNRTDKELSFYVQSPSDFEMELGWNPLTLSAEDEKTWQPGAYRGISLWGHFPENLTLGLKARQFGRGLLSLTRRAESPGQTAPGPRR